MKTPVWVMCILLGLASYVACILAQGFPLWSTGQPFLWFPQDTGSIIELIGFVSGVIAVYLYTIPLKVGYLVGVVNVVAYAYLFFAELQHYGNGLLQLVWLYYMFDGWWNWRKQSESEDFVVARITQRQGLISLGTFALLTPLAYAGLVQAGGKLPFLDAATTGISLAAQFLQNRRVLECWPVWMFVNVLYVGMYASRGWYATMLLAVIFFFLALRGLILWRRLEKASVAA